MNPDQSTSQDLPTGTLRKTVFGRFGTWKKGLRVFVGRTKGIAGLTLTRVRWKGSRHTRLTNVMVGVPASLVEFNGPGKGHAGPRKGPKKENKPLSIRRSGVTK